jgi:ornithine lipid ester-linked acyl 2-hydroxylase
VGYPLAKLLRAGMEAAIHRGVGGHVFAPTRFHWVAEVERHHPAIQREAEEVLRRLPTVVDFDSVLPGQRALTQGQGWKSYFLVAGGQRVRPHVEACPATTDALGNVPGLLNAFFSILQPGVTIPPHRGPYAGILRYHLGVIVPPGDCGIRVGQQLLRWREGESLVFDDSVEHEAWNRTDRPRVVLFVDLVRPLGATLAMLNRAVLRVFLLSETARRAQARIDATVSTGEKERCPPHR